VPQAGDRGRHEFCQPRNAGCGTGLRLFAHRDPRREDTGERQSRAGWLRARRTQGASDVPHKLLSTTLRPKGSEQSTARSPRSHTPGSATGSGHRLPTNGTRAVTCHQRGRRGTEPGPASSQAHAGAAFEPLAAAASS